MLSSIYVRCGRRTYQLIILLVVTVAFGGPFLLLHYLNCSHKLTAGTTLVQSISFPIPLLANFVPPPEPKTGLSESSRPILLLAWTGFFNYSLESQLEGFAACPNYGCQLSSNRSLLRQADALLFFYRSMFVADLPKERDARQRYIFFMTESPPYTGEGPKQPSLKSLSNFFNWTMSYRSDSDCFRPYYGIMERYLANPIPLTDAEKRRILGSKRNLVLYVSSHCSTVSRRELFVQALSKLVPVTKWGSCFAYNNKAACPKNSADKCVKQRNQFKFYLAFENSICKDYVTEKLMDLWHTVDSVPIVLKRSIVSGLMPASAFIAVDDFKNPQQMATYLSKLDKDDDAYLRYFHYRTNHRPKSFWSDLGFCCLCRRLRNLNEPAKTYGDVADLWFKKDDIDCISPADGGVVGRQMTAFK